MNLLAEIHRSPGINTHGRTIHRTAVRAVVLRGRDLLLVHSSSVGDYKFPGGGVMEGESHAQALQREVQEECGMGLTHVGEEIGAVIEYNLALESDYDVFKMTSYYYDCDVKDGSGIQTLDPYERQLGFQPVWMDIDLAIRLNKALLYSDNRPEWLRREIFILEYLQQNWLPGRNISNLKPAT
jgi:8-oxo-dGTP pyrophosphatase MutT (NUDIX family)